MTLDPIQPMSVFTNKGLLEASKVHFILAYDLQQQSPSERNHVVLED